MSTLTEQIIQNLDANAPMSIRNIVLTEVGKWQVHPKLKKMAEGAKYYRVENDILNVQRTTIGEKGMRVPVLNLADYRMPAALIRKLVDQKTGYSLSKEMNVQTDSEAFAQLLEKVFDRNFQRLLKNVGKDAINKGIAWVHMYYNENGELSRKRIKPEEIIPFWADEDHTELTALIRFYKVLEYVVDREIEIIKYELWTKEGVYRFDSRDLDLNESVVLAPHWMLPELGPDGLPLIGEDGVPQGTGYNWERIPFIGFKYNSEEQPLVSLIKAEVDAYDKIRSYLMNDIEDLPEQILALYNYSGTNLSEFRTNLAAYRAVMFERLSDAGESGMEVISQAIEIEARRFALELLRKDIFEFGRGVDTQADKFATAPSGEAQKYLYADLDMDADSLEAEFQFSLEQMLWFYVVDFANRSLGTFENEAVTFIFNRDVSINVTETISNLMNSDYLSLETRLAQHPYVDDAKAELERIEDERQQDTERFTQEQYQGLVNNDPTNPPVVTAGADDE